MFNKFVELKNEINEKILESYNQMKSESSVVSEFKSKVRNLFKRLQWPRPRFGDYLSEFKSTTLQEVIGSSSLRDDKLPNRPAKQYQKSSNSLTLQGIVINLTDEATYDIHLTSKEKK